MELKQATRKQAKIKMAIQGSSGSGKTYSSLLLAKGLTNDLSKVAIIDSEHSSSNLYAHLGNYNVLTIKPPFTPNSYIKAIEICEKAGMEVILIDSISHCWDYLLEYHSSLSGNSFTNWGKITPMQNNFINKILQTDAHIIATMRTKQDYVLNLKGGKYVPEKVGLKAIQRDDVSFEFTIVFDIDSKHFVISSKDRTNLFSSQPEFRITEATGRKILKWCDNDVDLKKVKAEIKSCETLEELRQIYSKYPNLKNQILDDIMEMKANIEEVQSQIVPNSEIIDNQKPTENGIEPTTS